MKKSIIYLFLFVSISNSFAQKTPFVKTQKKYLYDVINATDTSNAYKEVVLYNDNLDKTIWASPEKNCLTMTKEKEETFSGSYGLRFTWDKISGGCKWLGMGIGWNDFQPKDINDIVDNSAIQFYVKAVKGSYSNLPLAFGIEDYSGAQSYIGFDPKLASGKFNDTTWVKVTLPFKSFPFKQNDADLGKVKQFIIQFDADGDIYLDEIKIVEYSNAQN